MPTRRPTWPARCDFSIPQNVRVLRLPCTGKIEVNYLLAAFERGVDGVIVAGCLEGGCHFLEGNLRARRRVERRQELLGGDRPGARAAGDVQPLLGRGRPVRRDRDHHGRAAEATGPQPVAAATAETRRTEPFRKSTQQARSGPGRRIPIMIVADRKKIPEIRDMIEKHRPRAAGRAAAPA